MKANWFPALIFFITLVVITTDSIGTYRSRLAIHKKLTTTAVPQEAPWRGWGRYQIPDYNRQGELIRYGYDLITNTSHYLGPNGTVAQITNGLNCQNCHLEAGTLPYANNFGKVFSTYPRYRARNNGVQDIYDRINDCLQRSLNGKTIDTASREMQAMFAYMKWLGDGVPKDIALPGTSPVKLPYLDRAADPAAGRMVYLARCQTCHGSSGQGELNAKKDGYTYPPLWGTHSYNDGAGMFRLSGFAAFVKNNMPFGTDFHKPVLSNEEAWDVAAFVNSHERPHMDQSADWQDLVKKPVDYPYGPYIDTFSENQHKYGPFTPIKNFKK
jgi:thiosulfate dehydrogenase